MIALISGMLLFCAGHIVPRATGLRGRLIGSLGERAYKGIYSLVVGLGLALIIWGKANAEYVALYNPVPQMQHIAYLVMPFAFILLAAAYIPNNVRRAVKNPMMTATKLWAIVHLLINGDLASVILFSGFLFFAVATVIMAKRFELNKPHQPVAIGFDILTIALGIAATALVMAFHQSIAGVAAI
jgi:uncharacterized membrane protein